VNGNASAAALLPPTTRRTKEKGRRRISNLLKPSSAQHATNRSWSRGQSRAKPRIARATGELAVIEAPCAGKSRLDAVDRPALAADTYSDAHTDSDAHADADARLGDLKGLEDRRHILFALRAFLHVGLLRMRPT
jgi:hypothetical protein